MRINKSSLIYGTAFLTAVNLLSQLLAFFYRIALTRIIGAEAIGLYQLLMPVYIVLTSVCYSGLTVAVARIIAEKAVSSDYCGMGAVLRAAMKLFIFISLAVSAVVFLFSGGIADGFVGDGRAEKGLLLLLPCMILTGIENISKNYFYGMGNVRIPAVMEILEQLVRIISVIVFLLVLSPAGEGDAVALIVLGMIVCEIFSSVVLTVLRMRYLKRSCSRKLGRSSEKGLYKRLLIIAVPICATNLSGSVMDSVNTVLMPRRLVLSGLSSSEALEEIGRLFGMSQPLLMLPTVFIGAICLIIVPSLSKLSAEGDSEALKRRISKIFTASMAVTLPVMAFIVPMGPYIAKLLFGNAEVGTGLLPLAAGTVLVAVQAVTGSVAYGLGQQKAATFSFIAGDYLQVAFTYFLVSIPSLRLMGYIIGLIVSTLVTASINTVIILKAAKMKPKPFKWLILPLIAASTVYFVSSSAVPRASLNEAFIPVATGTAFLSLIICAVIFAFFTGRYDISILRSSDRTARSRRDMRT